MYKLAVESFFHLILHFDDNDANNNNIFNNLFINKHIAGDIQEKKLQGYLTKLNTWKSIIVEYKVNLNKFVEDGFHKTYNVYRPVSHAAQEHRKVEAFNGRKRKRKHKNKRSKQKRRKG